MAEKVQGMKLKSMVLDDSSDDERDTAAADDLDSLSLEKLNIGPKKKLLVLCLGGLLVDRVHKRNSASVEGHHPDLVSGTFLDDVLNCITSGIKSKFVFIWDQEECIDSGFRCLDNKHKPLFLKELKKIWENKNRTLPFPSGKYSSSNTLLIDSDPCKALINSLNTGIFPHGYKRDKCEDTFLGPKGELQVFLDGLAYADEVPSYVKEHAIGQHAITATHPDWSFYDRVCRHVSRMKAA